MFSPSEDLACWYEVCALLSCRRPLGVGDSNRNSNVSIFYVFFLFFMSVLRDGLILGLMVMLKMPPLASWGKGVCVGRVVLATLSGLSGRKQEGNACAACRGATSVDAQGLVGAGVAAALQAAWPSREIAPAGAIFKGPGLAGIVREMKG